MKTHTTIYSSKARGAFYDANAIERLDAECVKVTAQRDELLAAAKEARMALSLDYHGCTKPKKALCEVSEAARQAHFAVNLAIEHTQ